MSFNFQTQPDSSDDEVPVDINAWKSGSTSKPARAPAQAPAPVAPMVQPPTIISDDDEDGDSLPDIEASSFQTGQKRKRATHASPSPTLASGGFTSINQSAAGPSQSGAIAESPIEFPDIALGVDGAQDEEETVKTRLVPVLPRVDIDEEEVVDFTAGNDVVRRVLAELESDDGALIYKVELGDWSIEEVCSATLLCMIFIRELFSLLLIASDLRPVLLLQQQASCPISLRLLNEFVPAA